MNIRLLRPGILTRLANRLGWQMAWNEPGKDDDKKDPWSGNNQDGPPDLDEVVRKMQEKFGGLFGKKGSGGNRRRGPSDSSGFGFYFLIAGILAVLWLGYDMTYTIKAAERGVVLRFGKYATTIQPGLNIRLPRPIEYVRKVDITKVYSFSDKASMLTQDLNIVHIDLYVQYQISEPEKFLFNVRWSDTNRDSILQSAMESSVREVVGKSKMDFVMTEGREPIGQHAKELMQETLNQYLAGVLVTDLKVTSADPPNEVKEAFADVNKATEDEERLKNEAEAYHNDIIPKARGKAARIIADANAYKAQIIDQSKGDASRFEQLLAQYEKAPNVTRDRLYLETVEQVLGKSRKVMVDVKGGNNLMYLPLDQFINRGQGKTSSQTPQQSVQQPVSRSAPLHIRPGTTSGRGGMSR